MRFYAIVGLGLLFSLCPCVHAQAPQAASMSGRTWPAFDVTAFGAKPDGETVNTGAFRKAIEACAAAGGGTVFVPAGRFVTGAITLKSNVTLYVAAGAQILGSQNIEDFPLIEGRWEGVEVKHYSSLVNGDGLENIAIIGRGTIDARGKVWWDLLRAKKLQHPRGRLIGLYRCKNVLIEGVTLKNSPAWTVNPIYCDNVTVHGITIVNPSNSPNTDGINPDSSRNVHISDCHIDVGDDCITIKSGKDEDGRRLNRPCENITITNCTMLAGHGGVVIGSEMSGGVNNVVITNCVFDGTNRGIRLKTQRGRGGVVQGIRVSNIVMRNVDQALSFNMFYSKLPPEPVSERTPAFRNIHVSNITVNGAKTAGEFLGLPEMPLEDITISNASIDAVKGIQLTDAKGIKFRDVVINTEQGPALICKDTSDLEIEGFLTRKPHGGTPVVELKNVKGAFLHGCSAVAGTDVFLQIDGPSSADVLLSGNNLAKAAQVFRLGEDVKKEAVINRTK
jgi:polygalacturonase